MKAFFLFSCKEACIVFAFIGSLLKESVDAAMLLSRRKRFNLRLDIHEPFNAFHADKSVLDSDKYPNI